MPGSLATHRSRSLRCAFAGAALAAALVSAAQGTGWKANPDIVRAATRQQPKFNFDEAAVPPCSLPDLLVTPTAVVRTPGEWGARRSQILEFFRDNVYGKSPGLPERIRFEVVEENAKAMAGAATLKRKVNASPVFALWGDAPMVADAMPPLVADLTDVLGWKQPGAGR